MLDELIQGVLSGRGFDPRDIFVNVLAGLVAVVAIVALRWARGRAETGGRRRSPARRPLRRARAVALTRSLVVLRGQ